MSSSDVRMLEALEARVAALEAAVRHAQEAIAALIEAVQGKDVSGELYGAVADHAADREARAGLVRRPKRFPAEE